MLNPSNVIIIEGVFSFYDKKLNKEIANLKIFLDTDEDIRLSRRGYYIN